MDTKITFSKAVKNDLGMIIDAMQELKQELDSFMSLKSLNHDKYLCSFMTDYDTVFIDARTNVTE